MSDERTFTQTELDQIINERLKRERQKYQQETAQREKELDRREKLLDAKNDWTKRGLPVDLLETLDIMNDEAVSAAAAILERQNKQPTYAATGGIDPHREPGGKFQGDPLRSAFGLSQERMNN